MKLSHKPALIETLRVRPAIKAGLRPLAEAAQAYMRRLLAESYQKLRKGLANKQNPESPMFADRLEFQTAPALPRNFTSGFILRTEFEESL